MAETNSQLREYEEGEFVCIGGKKGTLGAGAFGVVQLASHRVLGNVALKCFPVLGGDHEKEQVALEIQNELEMLQKANHEHILRVHGWTEWSGSMALILEYMPGGNLGRLLRDPRIKLSPVLRLRVCFEIAKSLAFIHNLMEEKRLTHGDVKPANVLLTKDLHCKLGDFGSAKVAQRTGFTDTTASGQLSTELTLAYAAPERLAGPTKPNKAHDTYSFGIIVHTVLSGHAPHEYYANGKQYIEAVKKGDRPRRGKIEEMKQSLTSDRDKRIIRTLESVMVRCWEQNPSHRPEMLEIRDELGELLSESRHAETLSSVATAVSMMEIFIPTKSSMTVPLKMFDTRKKVFETEKVQQLPSFHPNDEQMATMDLTVHSGSKQKRKFKEPENMATISESSVPSHQGKMKQWPASRRDDVETAAMVATPHIPPRERGVHFESEVESTISQSTVLSHQGKMKQWPASRRDDVETAAMVATPHIPPRERGVHFESEVESTISQSTVLSHQGKMKQWPASRRDDVETAAMVSTPHIPPRETGINFESEVESTISQSRVALTQEKVNQCPSRNQADAEMDTMSLTFHIAPQQMDKPRQSATFAALSQNTVSSIQDSGHLCKYRALHNFAAEFSDELPLFVGDIITVDESKRGDLGWLLGEKNGKSGWVPDNSIVKIKSRVAKKVNQLPSFHRDDIEMATMALTSRIPPQGTDMHHESETEATITQEKLNQLLSVHHDDVEMDTMALTSHFPPQRPDESRGSEYLATISQSATSSTQENLHLFKYKVLHNFTARNPDELSAVAGDIITVDSSKHGDQGWLLGEKDGKSGWIPDIFLEKMKSGEKFNQLPSALQTDVEIATVALTSRFPQQQIDKDREAEVEATISQSAMISVREKLNQLLSVHHDDVEMDTMALTSHFPPQRPDESRGSEYLATISQSATSSTQENLHLFKYKVLHNFTARNPDELSAVAGDIITVDSSKHGDQGWLSGEKDGKSGWIPDNFVEKMKSGDCSHLHKYKALCDFAARNTDELSMVVGDIITVDESKHGDSGWLSGKKDGKSGWIPNNFVEKIKSKKRAAPKPPVSTKPTNNGYF